jgi:NAD(P)-dependent dehydrogenase (short-subunit alcohol dehydrogenase family)
VITGGNSGIGLATAQRFVEEGAFVFITGRRKDELDKAVKQIGRIVMGVQGDVSNLADRPIERLLLYSPAGSRSNIITEREDQYLSCARNLQGRFRRQRKEDTDC